MTFIVKTWENYPNETTPLNAAGMIDLETRLSAYTDAKTAGIVNGSQVVGGNLGATYTLNLTSTFVQFTGTLTANCALTITGLTVGCSAVLLLTQDGTGGRTLSVNGTSVTISTSPGSTFDVQLWSPDGSTLYLQPGPQTGATGATGPAGPNPRLLAWGAQGEPYPASAISSSASALTSGRVEAALMDLYIGQIVTGVIVPLDAYSASLTHQWVGLCNSAGEVLVASTDSPTLLNSGVASGLAAMIELPFSTTYTVLTTGGYYAFFLATQSSGTMPSFYRSNAVGTYNAITGGNAGTGVPLFGFQTGISSLPTVGSGSFTFAKESTPYYIGIY